MENKKNYVNTSVYWSKDWLKVCQFEYLEHFRTPEDSQVEKSMWYKIKISTTYDWWKEDKKYIMLEDQEIVDLIAVFINRLDSITVKREWPKHLEIKNQGDSYFLTFKSNNTNHAFKVSKFTALKVVNYWLWALETNEEKSGTWKPFINGWTLDIIKELYPYIINKNHSENKEKTEENTYKKVENNEKKVNSKKDEIKVENVEDDSWEVLNWTQCEDCRHNFVEKEQRVIDFSKKNFNWHIYCFQCQKNHKN